MLRLTYDVRNFGPSYGGKLIEFYIGDENFEKSDGKSVLYGRCFVEFRRRYLLKRNEIPTSFEPNDEFDNAFVNVPGHEDFREGTIKFFKSRGYGNPFDIVHIVQKTRDLGKIGDDDVDEMKLIKKYFPELIGKCELLTRKHDWVEI